MKSLKAVGVLLLGAVLLVGCTDKEEPISPKLKDKAEELQDYDTKLYASKVESLIQPVIDTPLPNKTVDANGNELAKDKEPDEFDISAATALVTEGVLLLAEGEEPYYTTLVTGTAEEKTASKLLLSESILEIEELLMYTRQLDLYGGVIQANPLALELHTDLKTMWKEYLVWYKLRDTLGKGDEKKIDASREKMIKVMVTTDDKVHQLEEKYSNMIIESEDEDK